VGTRREARRVEAGTGSAGDAGSLADLVEAARGCRACDLWRNATQTVFGEGPAHARLMLVGEQTGDREDLSGHPFVGPAGRLLDRALADAGIERRDVYVTNAVKHFKWVPRGKARIHKKPGGREIAACRPWLDRELALVQPLGVLCLGATAAQALLGPAVRVTRERGRAIASDLAAVVMVTVHPSSLLRAPTDADRERELGHFVADLRAFAAAVTGATGHVRRRA
jgi:DNA polymerase